MGLCSPLTRELLQNEDSGSLGPGERVPTGGHSTEGSVVTSADQMLSCCVDDWTAAPVGGGGVFSVVLRLNPPYYILYLTRGHDH